jgi:hypothetical protein
MEEGRRKREEEVGAWLSQNLLIMMVHMYLSLP